MRRLTFIAMVLFTQLLYAGAKVYQAGKLNEVAIKDMTTTMSLQALSEAPKKR